MLAAVAGLLFATSCKKDEDEPAATTSDTQKLVNGSPWIVSGFEATSGGQTTDWYAAWNDCDKDDESTYTTTMVTVTEGATNCYGDPYDTLGVAAWSFPAAGMIQLDGDTFNIVELSATTLKISETVDNGGTSVVYVETFTAQ